MHMHMYEYCAHAKSALEQYVVNETIKATIFIYGGFLWVSSHKLIIDSSGSLFNV